MNKRELKEMISGLIEEGWWQEQLPFFNDLTDKSLSDLESMLDQINKKNPGRGMGGKFKSKFIVQIKDAIENHSDFVQEEKTNFISFNTSVKKDGKNYILTQGKGEEADDIVISASMAKALVEFIKGEK